MPAGSRSLLLLLLVRSTLALEGCLPMFCDCSRRETSRPPPASVKSLVSSMTSSQGMPLTYLAPPEYWLKYSGDWDLEDRQALSYGLDLAAGAVWQMASSLARSTSASSRFTDMLLVNPNWAVSRNLTQLRGCGDPWMYGEQRKVFAGSSGRGQCMEGYLFEVMSDRQAWPDPKDIASGTCTPLTCPTYQFTATGVPTLRASAWAAVLGPTQASQIRRLLTRGQPVPLQLLENLLSALQSSKATIGGHYESPTTNANAGLTIDIGSNILLSAGLSMAVAYGAIPPEVSDLSISLRRFLQTSRTVGGEYYAWNSDLQVFRRFIHVPNPANASDIKLDGTWSLDTQLIALGFHGTYLGSLYGLSSDAAFNLWEKCKSTFGVFNENALIGFSPEAGSAAPVSEVTSFAIVVGVKLMRQYSSQTTIRNSISADVTSMQSVGTGALPAYGCFLNPNTTSMENNKPVTSQRYGFIQQEGKAPKYPALVSLEATGWQVTVSAAQDPLVQFDPFILARAVPGGVSPVPVPPPPKKEKSSWFKSNWGYLLGGLVAAAAIVLSLFKVVQLKRVRMRYESLRAAEESTKGQNLGFF